MWIAITVARQSSWSLHWEFWKKRPCLLRPWNLAVTSLTTGIFLDHDPVVLLGANDSMMAKAIVPKVLSMAEMLNLSADANLPDERLA